MAMGEAKVAARHSRHDRWLLQRYSLSVVQLRGHDRCVAEQDELARGAPQAWLHYSIVRQHSCDAISLDFKCVQRECFFAQ